MASFILNRRLFIKTGTLSLLALPQILVASNVSSRSIAVDNIHTGEKLDLVYWEKGSYIPESLNRINYLLRDYRNGEVLEIAPRLLDTLTALHLGLDASHPSELISGYRSPATNAMLRSQGHGVAENSLHIKGMAADIRVPGRSLEAIRKAALALHAGGVGYYPGQFVHVDIGRIRTW